MTMAVFVTFVVAKDYLKSRKFDRNNLLFLASAAAGSALFFLAPGNFARFNSHEGYSDRSILGRTYANASEMLWHYLNWRDNGLFLLLLAGFACLAALCLYRANRLNFWVFASIPSLALLTLLSSVTSDIAVVNHFFGSYFQGARPNFLDPLIFVLFFAFCGLVVFVFLRYLYFENETFMFAFLISALVSQIIFLPVAPYIVERMMIIFYFALFVVFIRILAGLHLKSRIVKDSSLAFVLIPTIALSALVLGRLGWGYSLNAQMHIENDRIMRTAAEDLRNGIDVDQIVFQDGNWFFSAGFPDFTLFWMLEYYDIPFGEVPILHPDPQVGWWPTQQMCANTPEVRACQHWWGAE